MKFTKDFLRGLISWQEPLGGELIQNEITGHGRWTIDHNIVFSYGDKYYMTDYSVGATESQDESPWQYDPAEIECIEVRPVEKTVITYEKV